MYMFKREKQISFTDFNQPQGMQMNPNNRWVRNIMKRAPQGVNCRIAARGDALR